MNTRDELYMAECLRLALKGTGSVSPNPRVGSVLVRGGRIVGRGWHRTFGGQHAEVECLSSVRGDTRGATMYVNLEPCSHHGKTPPCVDTIIRAGVRTVVAAMQDPNPRVAGRGFRRLRAAGIAVRSGILKEEAGELNRMYAAAIRRRRPYIHVKIAQSLDGRISRRGRGRGWITGSDARRLVHRWRAEYDAVLVGAGTVLADDPRLTVRGIRGRNPAAVILDGRCTVSPEAALFRARRHVIVVVDQRMQKSRKRRIEKLRRTGASVLLMRGGAGFRISVRNIALELYRQNIGSVLVEGGAEVFAQFLDAGVVDEFSLMIAPELIGDGLPAFPARRGRPAFRPGVLEPAISVGRDVIISARRA